ncbi:MAG: hypothetical protein EP330_26875 [Deltaproteobacteria bacterium]|nr:MAG: hypothetical protein EP330_26875 [Deltaproteobacteria bacterium]
MGRPEAVLHSSTEPWYKRIDHWFWAAVFVALVVRVGFMLLPLQGGCVRDECSYQILARKIAAGEGLQPQMGWLWAPLHPYVFAFFLKVFGDSFAMKPFQVALSTITVALVGWMGRRVSDETGRWAAWITALHPTLAFFASTFWSESLYSFVLVAGLAATLKAREGRRRWAALAGFFIGLTFLARGIATLLPPLFLVTLLWPETGTCRESWERLKGSAAVLALATTLTFAPYSIKASVEHGGLILSDATVGQQFFFGNNRFSPVTFDLGNGLYSDFSIQNVRMRGRPQCDRDLGVVQWNRCETWAGLQFIAENPVLFVERIPLRWAQLFNPHTFLTRHARWGRFVSMPWWAKEGLNLWVLTYSFGLLWAGSVAMWKRARGAVGVFSVAIWVYYLAVIAVFFGISRLRLPLEPFLAIWVGAMLAERGVDVPRWRKIGAWLTLAALVPLTLWFFPHGLPMPH